MELQRWGLVQSGEIYTRGENNNDIKIVLRGKAHLDFRAESTNGQADSIKFLVYLQSPSPSTRSLSKGKTFNRKEKFAYGNSHYTYDFSNKRDGIWTSILDSIYIPLGETTCNTQYFDGSVAKFYVNVR
ncbi:hypothetical protein [Portibacter marinus]|uniref:hypothetical protein n=1 Tax=Portibacter marinus TaxID=2898660 RepID=UPI001F333654|nr:hypothetical protein [Portibacter marinus]